MTAILGGYEKTAKQHAPQTTATDSLVFTDDPDLQAGTSRLHDVSPYRFGLDEALDCDARFVNNLRHNQHSFQRAKFIKLGLHRLPELRRYDYAVWLDGTLQITSPRFSEMVVSMLRVKPIVVFTHPWRKGVLSDEVEGSNFERYTSTSWHGQSQPFQDVDRQYRNYLEEGFVEKWFSRGPWWLDRRRWRRLGRPFDEKVGVWCTGLAALDLRSRFVHEFLDLWWREILRHTTQDQVSFPYVCWKLGFLPYSLPPDDRRVQGDIFQSNVTHYYPHGS